MIKWLFFDLGSTIIDESDCDEYRLNALLQQTGAPDRGELEACMDQLARSNLHPYRDAAKHYGLRTSPWPTHLEKLYPQAKEILHSLSKRYRLGVIANQNIGTEERLKAFGIYSYFDVIVASAECGVAKPEEEIFRIALKEASCIPQDAVMIGDRLDNDILPAAQIGMQTLWIRQAMIRLVDVESIGARPTYIADTLSEVCELFASQAEDRQGEK